MFMAFVTFTLPTILKDMRAATGHVPLTASNLALNSDEEDDSSTNSALETVSKALKRMEVEVLNMRDDLVDRVDTALQATTENKENTVEKRLGTLEKLLQTNIEQHKVLSSNIEKLNVALATRNNSGDATL